MIAEALADFRAMYDDHAPHPRTISKGDHAANCSLLLDHIAGIEERLEDRPPAVDVALQASANRHMAGEIERLKGRATEVERLAADVAHLLIAHRGMGADDARRLLGLLGVE